MVGGSVAVAIMVVTGETLGGGLLYCTHSLSLEPLGAWRSLCLISA